VVKLLDRRVVLAQLGVALLHCHLELNRLNSLTHAFVGEELLLGLVGLQLGVLSGEALARLLEALVQKFTGVLHLMEVCSDQESYLSVRDRIALLCSSARSLKAGHRRGRGLIDGLEVGELDGTEGLLLHRSSLLHHLSEVEVGRVRIFKELLLHLFCSETISQVQAEHLPHHLNVMLDEGFVLEHAKADGLDPHVGHDQVFAVHPLFFADCQI